ncbi:MAG: glutamate-cysteine ligase family protein [Myxococcales bacterium]|nr:glutamate-cysteine ligase family protein [Myxococcales bacterium]
MGIRVDRDRFEASEFEAFRARLCDSLTALEGLLEREGFGLGDASLGAEVELSLVDDSARALPVNRAVLGQSLDEHVQLELDRFNLEYNLSPVPARGRPFGTLEAELTRAIEELDRIAADFGGRTITVGILPTLEPSDLDRHSMTDLARYRALSHAIRTLRGGPAELHIHGAEPLRMAIDDVTMEGAATSLQVHLRVAPGDFANVYNAAQLAAAPAVAIAENSPFFLGYRLWRETRVALFKQAVDARGRDARRARQPARVCFGHGWVQRSAFELFAETVGLFAPLIPICDPEQPLAVLGAGHTPRLRELSLHMGTVWRWNRPVYDPVDGGHLRIEFRALPSGPTPVDAMANAAFCVGLTLGLAERMSRTVQNFPFEYAHHNFYRAAQYGLEASLLWPSEQAAPSYRQLSASELLPELLPLAREGLQALGVEQAESARLLGIIDARAESGRTGARFQLEQVEALEKSAGRWEALAEMTRRYIEHSKGGRPVHEWSLDK